MHLNLHKKAYKKVLLIANGYEPYHNDISNLTESVHYIDPYSQDKNYVQSLETFKKYLEDNNLDSESTKILNEASTNSHYNNTDLDKNVTILCSLVNEYIDAFEIDHVRTNSTFLIIENFFSKVNKASLINILDIDKMARNVAAELIRM